MYSVMFVCHGNICRSPMAEFIFRDAVKKAGRTGEFFVASSAVSDEEIFGGVGNPVYPPARAVLKAARVRARGSGLRFCAFPTRKNTICLHVWTRATCGRQRGFSERRARKNAKSCFPSRAAGTCPILGTRGISSGRTRTFAEE